MDDTHYEMKRVTGRRSPEVQDGSHDPELTGGENTPMTRSDRFHEAFRASRADPWADDPFAGIPNTRDEWNERM